MKGSKINISNVLENSIKRSRRDLASSDNNTPKPKRLKVRKKLIRIEPIYHNELKQLSMVESDEKIYTGRRKMRRKLKIKKKKRKLIPQSPLVDLQESIPSNSPRRRKVVVTKKRLLKPSTIITSVKLESITSDSSSSLIKSTSTVSPSDVFDVQEDNSTDNPIFGDSDENDYENATEEDNINDEDDEEEHQDDTTEDYDEENEEDDEAEEDDPDDEYIGNEDQVQHVPDYEPFFPELSETFEAPVLLLKTTVLSSVELQTKTVVQSRLRTYTFLITRVSGTEQIVTSTTEVKPHVKTTTVTDSLTKLTTLTLLDFDATSTINQKTITPFSGSYQQLTDPEDPEENRYDEARNYLATRVMSNGVEVIVAGDKSTLPGEPDVKRVLPSTIFKPVTLRPSTLSEHMMMLMPSDASRINSITSSLYPNNKFVTKTCLTTFTYLTTYLESGTTTVSSHEQVVSNIATEERNTGKLSPTPSMGITLTQYPSLSVGVFYTTYTYINTIVDGDQPLVITSKHTVTNTVTAPDDYLSLIQPSESVIPQRDTNTYYSTIMLTKTVEDGESSKVISTNERVTQIVITESIPPKATSVMTSYIALDVEDPPSDVSLTTTDVIKTYYITYTYYDTVVEEGKTVVHTNISTAKDVTTEKIYLQSKRPNKPSQDKEEVSPDNVVIIATKTYQTTFTYFTTLLQEDNSATPTVVSSHSKIVENIATETIHPKQLNENYWKMLKSELEYVRDQVKETVVLNDGQKLEVTAYKKVIQPTKVLPIQMTEKPNSSSNKINLESSNPNVITGSTIVFFDDDPFASATPTPTLKSSKKNTNKNTATLSSEVIKKTQILTSSSKLKKSKTQNIKPTKSNAASRPSKYKADNTKKKQATKVTKPVISDKIGTTGDLLGLGSINIESLKALTPVINAMAGLIQTNLKPNRKEATSNVTNRVKTHQANKNKLSLYPNDTQNRSPIYIPVGDMEVSESQNIASYLQETVDWEGNKVKLKKPTHETPLLSGGIPISPGEVITANSDVIVGKPGRILPRLPAIPLSPNHITEVGDLNPPPVPNNWDKKNNQKHIPLGAHSEPAPAIVHAPNKDDYIGPPPPPTTKSHTRGDKHKHIPIRINNDHKSVRRPERPYMHIPINQNYAHHQNNYDVNYHDNEIRKPTQPSGLQVEIQKKYEELSQGNVPIYAQQHASPAKSYASNVQNMNIQPSVIREHIVLPEVIERSTGQPLLVNIQPSQVAFVNIPHNRTTALIYGGSTEPHRNGQYFDDPSPYSGSEYQANENYNNVVRYTSEYNVQPNQKQVKGVIKVGTQAINVQPDHSNSRIEHISPSRPLDLLVNANNQEVYVKVPPISFGMFHNGNDFNAHIINHANSANDFQFQSPAIAYEVTKSQIKDLSKKHGQNHEAYSKSDEIVIDNNAQIRKKIQDYRPNNKIQTQQPVRQSQPSSNYQDNQINIKHVHFNSTNTRRNNYNSLSQVKLQQNNQPKKPDRTKIKYQNPVNVNIPSSNVNSQGITLANYMLPPTYRPKQSIPAPFQAHYGQRPQIQTVSLNHDQNIQTHYNRHKNRVTRPGIKPTETSIGNDLVDHDYDLVNSDGEVIQESNSRPLRPGELPVEILKLKTTKVTIPNNTSSIHQSKHKFPYENEVNQVKPPVIEDPRPFIRPENYQTNQIVRFDHTNNGVIFQSNNYNLSSIKNLLREEIVKPYTATPPVNDYKPNNYNSKPQYNRDRHPGNPFHTNGRIEHVTVMPFKGNRPIVTSLPINPNLEQTEKSIVAYKPLSTQTEKPFNRSQVEYTFGGTVVPNHTNRDKHTKPPTDIYTPNRKPIKFNTTEYNLEVMTPPKPTQNTFKSTLLTLRPPEVVLNSPGSDIQRIPVLSEKPVEIVPLPADNMMPPPKATGGDEEVLGMSPPPMTYRPKISLRPKVPTSKPIFSLQIDTPKEKPRPFTRVTTTTPRTTQRVRTRRPYPPRRTFATTTTRRPTTRIPLRPNYRPLNRTRISTPKPNVYTKQPVSNIPTTPKLEVIIGDPSTSNKKEITNYSNYINDSAKSNSNSYKLNMSLINLNATKKDIIASSVHHAGNEVRITEQIQNLPTTITPALTSVKLVPTRFITHTHTSTVTITKTTVIKTPGGPPSTLTLLVTKTEQSTVVDTVTEFHTLVKPTNIIETITTTIQTGSLYPSDVYGTPYPSIQIRPTKTIIGHIVTPSTIEHVSENLDEFIITDTDPPSTSNESQITMQDNDTIFVVMTDKKHGSIIKIPPVEETQSRDEMLVNNKVNDVQIAGILSANHPSIDADPKITDRCDPECKASRNELCQKSNGLMRCVCRPGFARMFPDRPCNPTYTYSMEIDLERLGRKKLAFNEHLNDSNSTEFKRLAATTHEALDRMVMQSDLRDIYHGVHLHSFKPGKTGVINNFHLQLSDNTDEKRLEDVFKKYLRGNNFSLGGTDLFASKSSQQSLRAIDFDECHNFKYHDCSDNAQCFNLKGTYTCSCKEGFSDLSENVLYPGRVCSAELIGCEKCNYHGTCYSRGDEQTICECFQWYSGQTCYINLKVLLIALISLGFILFILLLICCIVTCCKEKPTPTINTGLSFFPQRVPHPADRSTLDRRAMIVDTSSEDSRSETNSLPPYVAKPKPKRPKSALKKSSLQRREDVENGQNIQTICDQKDRSLTVMIPRAKYHPAPPAPNMSSYTTFDASKASAVNKPQNNEAKLLSYLDAGPSPHKIEPKRKYSSQVSESYIDDEPASRKTSGALVSAGFEVSATVINNMGTLGTTCGTEADRSENATLIQKISADLLSCTGTRSQTNTLRNFDDDDLDPIANWMEIEPRITTISEARSYEETTIPPPMKSLRYEYDTKMSVHSNSHSHHHDEVAERDLGSTFLLPHTHLYKPDRGSDISGFESL